MAEPFFVATAHRAQNQKRKSCLAALPFLVLSDVKKRRSD